MPTRLQLAAQHGWTAPEGHAGQPHTRSARLSARDKVGQRSQAAPSAAQNAGGRLASLGGATGGDLEAAVAGTLRRQGQPALERPEEATRGGRPPAHVPAESKQGFWGAPPARAWRESSPRILRVSGDEGEEAEGPIPRVEIVELALHQLPVHLIPNIQHTRPTRPVQHTKTPLLKTHRLH